MPMSVRVPPPGRVAGGLALQRPLWGWQGERISSTATALDLRCAAVSQSWVAQGWAQDRLLPPSVPQRIIALALVAMLAGCAPTSEAGGKVSKEQRAERTGVTAQAPERFTIVPDDYHVPYAGTAEDGRKFFLSQELFSIEGTGYIGLFLWNPNGTFDEVRVEEVSRPGGVPPGQAAPAGAKALVKARLAELGDYVLEPIEVEPFTRKVDGVTFGWKVGQYEDGTYYINIEPGNFIAYYEPWDGLQYDT
jgi:hypothetical protein